MASPPRSAFRRLLVVLRWAVLLLLLNAVTAIWLFWRQYDTLGAALTSGSFPFERGTWELEVKQIDKERNKEKTFQVHLSRDGGDTALSVIIPDQKESPIHCWSMGEIIHLQAPSTGASFQAKGGDVELLRTAVLEAGAVLPELTLKERLLAALALRPLITGVKSTDDGALGWRLRTHYGTLWVRSDGTPIEAQISIPGWEGKLLTHAEPAPRPGKPDPAAEAVPGDEMMAALGEVVRIATLPISPVVRPPDGITRSGKGQLEVRNGHRQMFLSGTPFEIGHQHGALAGQRVEVVARRLVYGVGLLYSIKQKEWFPAAARDLVKRQKPFIREEYFEEMHGLAQGARLPLDLIQAANIFPEFFHCSGVALMGDATQGGELLHARVLDYMVGIGLQDEAAVMAIERPGVNKFITVGYLGFIGSVTGMNEKQVAIGEMGGAGQGDWDGTPMSLLIREALERCNTLGEVETFMREAKRTCEYYYLITDGKGPSALGVAATPEKFETFGPGEFHERLNQPVEDAVLLSGSGRYEKLVERVRAHQGKIDRDALIEIIKHPVSMRSNLHNVIFQPQSLRLSVADAVRGGMACDQPYRTYTWEELFVSSP